MKIIFEMDEEWKKIKKYPYIISSFGKVKRIESGKSTCIGKILKSSINTDGYLQINLCRYGKCKSFRIHKLVAEAFIGLCPDGKEANHKDGNKENPRVDNLEYVTSSENQKHAYKLGLRKSNKGKEYNEGENHPQSKLTEKDIGKIRKLYKTGKYYQKELAEKFNIDPSNISNIIRNKIWKHVI